MNHSTCAAGCQKVARFAASRGFWGRSPDEHRSDRTSQEGQVPATTVSATVVLLEGNGNPEIANSQVNECFCGGRGTRTHKPFRATVFKCVAGRPDWPCLLLPDAICAGQQ